VGSSPHIRRPSAGRPRGLSVTSPMSLARAAANARSAGRGRPAAGFPPPQPTAFPSTVLGSRLGDGVQRFRGCEIRQERAQIHV
jgi:hypothetical protein